MKMIFFKFCFVLLENIEGLTLLILDTSRIEI